MLIYANHFVAVAFAAQALYYLVVNSNGTTTMQWVERGIRDEPSSRQTFFLVSL